MPAFCLPEEACRLSSCYDFRRRNRSRSRISPRDKVCPPGQAQKDLASVLRANVDTGHMDVQIPVFAVNSQSLSRNDLGVVNFPF